MKTPLVAALCLALAACAASSPRIDPVRLDALQKGKTTIAEVVRQFGRPSILSKNPDGTQSAIYIHGEGPGRSALIPLVAIEPVDSVTLYFDTRGVFTDYKSTEAAPVPAQSPGAGAPPAVAATADTGKPAATSSPSSSQSSSAPWQLRRILPPSTTENR